MKLLIKRKINRINKEILNLEIGKDGRYQQLVREREGLERSAHK